jgi:hypothetical protein
MKILKILTSKKINTGPYIATLREKRVMPQCEKQN